MDAPGRNGLFDGVHDDFRLYTSGISYWACHLPFFVLWDGAQADLTQDDAALGTEDYSTATAKTLAPK